MQKNEIGFSTCFPYGINEGPCVYDDQCRDDLFCGYKNCLASFGNDDGVYCSDTCGNPTYKGDNYCDDENNNCGCEWDGGDCCGSDINTQHCTACECLEVDCCGINQFKSPNYPNKYFSDDIKTWLIKAPVGSIIILQFHSFHVRLIVEFDDIIISKNQIYSFHRLIVLMTLLQSMMDQMTNQLKLNN